ncbi:MAG: hypothetical protein Ct9H300mP8_01420 [Gammaproteobacteria bacterium]|nr:MAG: hypothetical protein Ct9H300mP8_01420 [Gammaproteobacteria bacterium]
MPMITPTTIRNFFISTLYLADHSPVAWVDRKTVSVVPNGAGEYNV